MTLSSTNTVKTSVNSVPFAIVADSVTSRNLPAVVPLSTTPIKLLSLLDAAAEITRLANEADDKTLLAAKKVVALKKRIERGEAGPDQKWMEWLRLNIDLSESRLYELVKIGEHSDPKWALERIRQKNREKSKKRRKANSESEMSEDRRLLLKVTRRLPEAEVTAKLREYNKRFPRLF
jgi:hypothetical protein